MGCVGGQALANRRLFCVFSLLEGQNVKVKPKILIADDSVMNQQVLTEILGDSYESVCRQRLAGAGGAQRAAPDL